MIQLVNGFEAGYPGRIFGESARFTESYTVDLETTSKGCFGIGINSDGVSISFDDKLVIVLDQFVSLSYADKEVGKTGVGTVAVNAWNYIEVRHDGMRVTLAIDGVSVLSVKNITFSYNKITLTPRTSMLLDDMYFDDLPVFLGDCLVLSSMPYLPKLIHAVQTTSLHVVNPVTGLAWTARDVIGMRGHSMLVSREHMSTDGHSVVI
jgi:hypothetical protein